LGTWCIAGMETDAPVLDPRVVEINCGNEGGVCGKNMLLRNITGLWILQASRDKWNKERGEEIDWDHINELAGQAKMQNSIIDVDDPRFGEYQEDMPAVIAEFCRQTGQDVPETIGEVACCIIKSLVLKFKASFADISLVTGGPFAMLHLVGGGTRNRLLCRWTAEAMGILVIAGPTETTSVGNLIFQLMADGKISSIEEGRKLCKKSYETIEYWPGNQEFWDLSYEHYLEIVAKRKKQELS
jgi:rhamnulokinase